MAGNPKREFIRHTVDVPLEVRAVNGETARQQGVNVSHGGLAFVSETCPSVGDLIDLRITTVDPPFSARGRVAWCRSEDDRYLVGVAFLDAADAFRARMVQQVCSIQRYRQEVEAVEGRSLSTPEAATEWINRYADRFPGFSPSGRDSAPTDVV
ncbi:hypothetical protein BH23GEM6_BH23GEM6_17520 [soil metagenome]